MSLSFFHPLFWLGALAVAAPVYLHLRRKQPHDLFHFSTIRFLDDQPLPRQSPLTPRDLLLLTLRVLSLLLLVAAFAWPFRGGDSRVIVKESRVYILDNSLSHQVENGFARDRDRVVSDLGKAGKEFQIAVIELTTTPRVVVTFGDDHELARQKVAQLQPSFQRGSYYAAFRQAGALFATSLGEKRKIVLFGDNQENQWADNLDSPPFLDNVQVEIPTTAPAQRANVSVFEPRAQRIFMGDKSLVNFTAQIGHRGDIPTARILFRVNAQEVISREVDLTKGPETFTFQTEWEADPTLQLNCEVAVEARGDSLKGDNHAYYSLPAEQEGSVALLAQSSFLKLALSPEVMRGHWAARVIDPSRIAAELESSEDADVLCIEGNYLQSGDARKLMSRYLAEGHGVFLMVNRILPSTKAYLKEVGFELQPATKAGSAHFQYVFASHPILYPFTSPDYGNLMEVQVTDPASLRADKALPLIFTDKGEPVLFQKVQGTGKLLVQAFGFERSQTSWPVHETFLPYLDLCLQHLRAADPTPTVFEPAEVLARTFRTNSGVVTLVLKDQKELARAAVVNGKAQLRLPDQPGFYTVACEGSAPSQRTICINPSHKESDLTYTNTPQAMLTWRMPSAAPVAAAPKGVATAASILQERIWWWLLMAAFAGLCGECIWTILRSRLRGIGNAVPYGYRQSDVQSKGRSA